MLWRALDPAGYTSLLVQELQRYSRRDKPLQICLAWQEHRKLTEEQFEEIEADLGLFGEIVCLDPDGNPFTWKRGRKGAPDPANQPLYLAGGFGGITTDIGKAIGIDNGAWLPLRTDGPARDPRLPPALAELSELTWKRGPDALANGLSADENRRLAATHRQSEIAALVSLGLGRRFGGKR